MAQRKLQEFDEYRYGPRSVLKPGDTFRVGGGPVYITDDGIEHMVAERGLFKFRRYCEQGAQKWIEAYPGGRWWCRALVGRKGRQKSGRTQSAEEAL